MPTALSTWDRAMTDLQGVIQGLCPITSPASTPEVGPIQSANVIVQQVEERLQIPNNPPWPVVIITNQGMTEEEGEWSDFENDNIVYPIAVVLVDQARRDPQKARGDYQYMRRTMQNKIRGLVNLPLFLNTPEISDVRLVNLEAIPANIAELQVYAMGFVVQCHAWETRTRGGNGT